ncbi:MAG TPA: TPM domain-containing protein [Longimicrobium sp.]|nr:TPM domain-containing protein [Longimicrobium sp.]
MTMIQHLRSAALPLLLGALPAAPLAAQYPAEPGNGIADLAGIIGPADADSIRALLNALRADPGVEVRVLTVQSIARYDSTAPTPEAFATAVYNEWKLGYGQAQDGVLVMVSVDDRFARIELGDGVPAHQEGRMRAIMDERMVPRFREGDYSGGVMQGVDGIVASFRGTGPYAPARDTYTPAPQPAGGFSDPQPAYRAPVDDTGDGGDDGVLAVLGLLGLGAAGIGGATYLRHRKRSCAQCGRPMQRLDEAADDACLESGRRLEEVLGSVDYDVWKCTGCSNHQVLPYGGWFTKMRTCPQCSYRTMSVSASVLEAPTYRSSGRELVTRFCRHCNWRDEDVVVLPRLEETDSSSSSSSWSGGSSFGGGSFGGSSSGGGSSGGSSGGHSSGGGASGRW